MTSRAADWREPLLAGARPLPVPPPAQDRSGWPGYVPRPSVLAAEARVGDTDVVLAAWDFAVHGGSFGEADATALAVAADTAAATGRPLVTVLRSGGTRLQEGMAALVGIPRARLALGRLAAAGQPHLAVADQPTTGGVWIGVGSLADLRVAVEGAVVGFAGPRVVAAVTGTPVPATSHTAAAAYAAGLVDAVVTGPEVPGWLAAALAALAPDPTPATAPPVPPGPSVDRPGGAAQVARTRRRTTGGGELLHALLDGAVPLRGAPGGAVAAAVGRLAGRRVVGVALAETLGGRPTPAGYALLARAAALADRLGAPLLSLVDTPGAEPGPQAEAAGVAPAIGAAMDAVLACRSPVLVLVHGEGGSGGALAAAVGDEVVVTPDAYFTAIGPEGAAAALRVPPDEAADHLGLTPADLLALGFADGTAPPAPAEALRAVLGARLLRLAAQDPAARLEARAARWSAPLPGRA